MSLKNLITAFAPALLVWLTGEVNVLPAAYVPYGMAFITFLTAVYHLYQPNPSAIPPKV